MTVLVTGGTGLVGARLLPRLLKMGVEGRSLARSEKDVPGGVPTVTGDLLEPHSLRQAVEGVSAIVHLAAVFRMPDDDLIWRTNLGGTQNLIAAARAWAPKARFIMASTSNIYNSESSRPGREDDAAEPELAYPASKLAAEAELRESGLKWSVQRFGFVYGDKDGHLEALPKQAAKASWHPAQKLSLIHHRDIFVAMKLALAGAMDGRVVNIVDEAPTSIYELAELVGEPFEPSRAPLTNPWRLHVDGSLARRLGFSPSVRTVYQAVRESLL